MFKGSAVAIVTPFNEDYSVDYKTLEALLNWHVEQKTDAIVITGTTGEASTLTNKEHLEVIKFAVDVIDGRISVIAGTGSNDTHHMVYLSQKAQECGADALLCVTPYYNKATQEGLYQHFSVLAKAVDLPIILYTVPSRTNVEIDVETVIRLSKYDNIIGIKDATGNLAYTEEIIKNLPDFYVYSGNDDLIYDLVELGGHGVISVVANIYPNETHKLVKAYLDGDKEEAKNIQTELMRVIDHLFVEPNPIPVKYAMQELKLIPSGTLRLPLTTLSAKFHAGLEENLK
ncbi:MAG TPA: 4-hydroxy-tetrahydrodipicolinate synthase [Erysipelothrix sp.]|nr:4-hydroxy-tetrahydrodipicolinate synthase [Erysipelothrix sp.]